MKASEVLRFLAGVSIVALVLAVVFLRVTRHDPEPEAAPAAANPVLTASRATPDASADLTLGERPPPPPTPGDCSAGPRSAAEANAASLTQLSWTPFGQAETGWEIYAPLVAREIATDCPPQSPGFAAALAGWQTRQRLPADGVFTPDLFSRLVTGVELRRPFVRVSARGICPPAASDLETARKDEGYSGKIVMLRPDALAAYRRMVAAARAADPRIAADRRNLTIFSAFRDPEADTLRCAQEQNCDGVVRATCSSHRTGLAVDLYVGQAPGYGPDSSAEVNRRFISRTPAYRWLVANAPRFGFAPYPFEPWHWEWTGEPVRRLTSQRAEPDRPAFVGWRQEPGAQFAAAAGQGEDR